MRWSKGRSGTNEQCQRQQEAAGAGVHHGRDEYCPSSYSSLFTDNLELELLPTVDSFD